ncbi:hypothetical protein TRIUR3_14277 [Triticum urartu]|uniref:Uncharacterized protein n=1 Tax=Triticum urartu TaxID=4572 RepID=M7Z5T9_TRIUA|nr:hypothetical protein TRIUR3_14277 [Triticum urartu]
MARARLEEQVAYKVASRSNDWNIGSAENAVTDLACLIVISSLPCGFDGRRIIKAKSKGSKAVDHYLSQYTRHLSNIGENSADMFICKSYTQLATMLSKASTIPTLEPKEHVPNWTHTYGMKIYGEEKGPSLQSLGKLGNCNLFMDYA